MADPAPVTQELAVASIEPLLLDLSRRNNIPIPNLRDGGARTGVLRALEFLNYVSPALRLDDLEDAQRRAQEIVPGLNLKTGEQLHGGRAPQPSTENPANPPVKAVLASTNVDPTRPHYEYPKAVLQVDDLKLTRSAASEGRLTSVEGRIFIRSHCYMTLSKCRVAAVSLAESGLEQTLNGELFAGRRSPDNRETGEFVLRQGSVQSFPLIYRDLKDVVSEPPFLLRLAGQRIPLKDNSTFILTLDLHSEAKDVTRARIQIETSVGPDVTLTLLDQAVLPR